jgi:hypothetical protein
LSETIPGYLVWAFFKDMRNGEVEAPGLRDTTEVAARFSITTAQALRKLNRLYEQGHVVGYAGCPCLWRASGRALQGLQVELGGN